MSPCVSVISSVFFQSQPNQRRRTEAVDAAMASPTANAPKGVGMIASHQVILKTPHAHARQGIRFDQCQSIRAELCVSAVSRLSLTLSDSSNCVVNDKDNDRSDDRLARTL
jgi:hypothetical protein